MTRYVKLDEFGKYFDKMMAGCPLPKKTIAKIKQMWIDGMPTADVVEVVRCKDCKHWHSNTEFCGIWSFNFQNIAQRTLRDDYCSRAERREE